MGNPTGLCVLVGRVWYDPFGEIITHTLPLTLTDRLWTDARRDATIGLYQTAAGWYDPYSTQSIYAGVSVPQAPAGVSWGGGTYLGRPGAAGGGIDWLGVGWDIAVNVHNAWLSDVIANAIKVYLRAHPGQSSGQLTPLLLKSSLKKIAFAQGMIGWKTPGDISRHLLLSQKQLQYTWQLNKWLYMVELGSGILVDVGVSGLFELPMLLSGDLTFAQYAGRRGVTAGGSIVSWGAGFLTKTVLKEVFMVAAGTASIWGTVVAVSVSLAWGWWAEPWLYEQWPALYARSEKIGPSENLPW